MKATILQAENNKRNLTITMKGYGHWRIECDFRGRRISTITTNSSAVDDFNAEFGEKDGAGYNRRKQGYQDLINQIIRDNS